MRQFLKVLPLGLGLPVVIGAASVKPEDAASNLAAWAKWLGVQHAPEWLSSPTIDHRVIIGSLILALIYAFVAWGVPAIRRRLTEPSQGTPQTGSALVGRRAKIVFGTGHPFETVAPAGKNKNRTVRVKIENDAETEISNGTVRILNWTHLRKSIGTSF